MIFSSWAFNVTMKAHFVAYTLTTSTSILQPAFYVVYKSLEAINLSNDIQHALRNEDDYRLMATFPDRST